ncbi:uncharacterized protein EDB91DRAFT_1238569 [Suillus paluster]|uniref:uncharacterized protein n=1 Tax=Suillus paluster TaxID=48578 RepID=UPI001B867C04|nr:uncharacterized protein EDB91DRAFT_1238569 [Suillus paluster]KAG1733641.1 hypothetical protein EDB91DRAFT_1238569 [Suillus paluster]
MKIWLVIRVDWYLIAISSLPLPPSSHIVTHNLTPDPVTPSPAEFFSDVLPNKPSLQRRARLLSAEAHFSYVNPMPLEFPYEITPPDPPAVIEDKAGYIEKWLSEREAIHPSPVSSQMQPSLNKYTSKLRNRKRELIGLSETCLRDCLPHLDCLGKPALAPLIEEEAEAVRQELVDVLSGHAVLMAPESSSNPSFAPWSARYSGHQFGVWAGQLGDGRAISIHVTPHPEDVETTYELQLKGAGRTPFSRSADGLAVLRSSIREYLCSEGKPPCIFTRVAQSFIRIGNFEALSPPSNTFFLGGGQQNLGEWTARRAGDAWGKELILDVARRNAQMVAAWQAYGFMHGVMNTDNISILGLTIDYGPYAFMDVFDPYHICNHSDAEGRYAYKVDTPPLSAYACRALLDALAPLIGAEADQGNKAVQPGWASSVTPETLVSWRTVGKNLPKAEMERILEEAFDMEYANLMRKRLGLRRQEKSDQRSIVQPLLDMMEAQRLDFHGTFRRLAERMETFIKGILSGTPDPDSMDYVSAAEQWLTWLDKYSSRIESERRGKEWAGEADFDNARQAAAKSANPRFVLRQWVLEELIKKVEGDHDSGKRIMAKVMQMACKPFETWGAEGDDTPSDELPAEIREERRLCGLGDKRLLGFQCSCSS